MRSMWTVHLPHPLTRLFRTLYEWDDEDNLTAERKLNAGQSLKVNAGQDDSTTGDDSIISFNSFSLMTIPPSGMFPLDPIVEEPVDPGDGDYSVGSRGDRFCAS